MSRVIVEQRVIADVPIITIFPEGVLNSPVVFYTHGHLGDKTSGVQLGYLLAEQGITCVCPDAWLHGDRFDDSVFAKANGIYPRETGLDMFWRLFEVVQQTSQDISRLIAHFQSDPRVNTARVGASGMSMGAFTTFHLAAHNPFVKVAVPLIGYGTFAQRWQDVTLEAASYQKWHADMESVSGKSAERLSHIQRFDPAPLMKDFAPKPLLMISGDLDTDAPKLYNVQLYRELKPHYRDKPENLRLSIHDFVDHRITSAMLKETVAWFKQYL